MKNYKKLFCVLVILYSNYSISSHVDPLDNINGNNFPKMQQSSNSAFKAVQRVEQKNTSQASLLSIIDYYEQNLQRFLENEEIRHLATVYLKQYYEVIELNERIERICLVQKQRRNPTRKISQRK